MKKLNIHELYKQAIYSLTEEKGELLVKMPITKCIRPLMYRLTEIDGETYAQFKITTLKIINKSEETK